MTISETTATAGDRFTVGEDEDGTIHVIGDATPAQALAAIRRFTAAEGDPGPAADATDTLTTGWYVPSASVGDEDDPVYERVAAGTPGAVLFTSWRSW
ncbi:hypothetical protein ACFWIW_14095 [Amycolatopsis sp. NPDC058340]|uniref:hypothetical protein n=1 Tax=Amycolatopsis sp. NPDC058340 TaxID=3346453 RepID=UPI003650D44B